MHNKVLKKILKCLTVEWVLHIYWHVKSKIFRSTKSFQFMGHNGHKFCILIKNKSCFLPRWNVHKNHFCYLRWPIIQGFKSLLLLTHVTNQNYVITVDLFMPNTEYQILCTFKVNLWKVLNLMTIISTCWLQIGNPHFQITNIAQIFLSHQIWSLGFLLLMYCSHRYLHGSHTDWIP